MAETDQDDHKARLDALEQKLAQKREANAPKPHVDEHYSQAQQAWRMVIELVAGLGIGFGMGYGLDAAFGTSPFLMVIFIFLGFAAGIQTMMRTAKELNGVREASEAEDKVERD